MTAGVSRVSSPAPVEGGLQALKALIEEARRRARRRRRRYGFAALAVAALGAAAYGAGSTGSGSTPSTSARPDTEATLPAAHPVTVRNGTLTVINDATSQAISTLRPFDAPLVTCARFDPTVVCKGRAVSIDWAPDGRRLAFGTGIGPGGLRSELLDSGLYVYDTAARTYLHRALGCFATAVDWSPDGSQLAYVCDGRIRTIAADLTGSPKLFAPDERRYSSSPSWSPNGKHIVFAAVRRGMNNTTPPTIYVAPAAGDSPAAVARIGAGFTPAWSPDGTKIAFRAGCGIRLMTPAGSDVTPSYGARACAALGVAGTPVWSPDGRKLAIANDAGIHTMDADGRNLRLVSTETGRTMWGSGRPAWRPVPVRKR